MTIWDTRSRKTVFGGAAAAAAAAAAVATLGVAAPARADGQILNTHLGGACPDYCGDNSLLVGVGVDNTTPSVVVNFAADPGLQCPGFTVDVNFDAKTPVTLGAVTPLTPGGHSLNFRHAKCPGGGAMDKWTGTAIVSDVGAAAPANLPKQGPTVTPKQGLTGVTFHVTDRSGAASQCTYSSEGFESGFGLPANGSFDLFVPAIRELRNRTGTVTCDNGTSTNTSVFY
jgi:hypothetical protein